jgi:hypothetical protein
MVPGSDPAGVSVTVRNGPVGPRVDAAMIEGGFDPIAIPAQPGDTLLITVHHANGGSEPGYAVVPAQTRPGVVRTSPPHGKTEVVLNGVIRVIFTEPMDAASLAGALHLRQAGTDVAGTVTVDPVPDPGLSAQFVPASLLAPLTTYEFEVSTAALGQSGEPLEAPVLVEFTTGTDAAAVAKVTIMPSPLQRVVGGQQQLWALPVNAAGTALTTSCAWGTSDAAVADISSTGLLSAFTVGTALIRAACGGVVGEATVTVVPVPSGLVFASVSTYTWHTCGLTTAGAAYCWGRNDDGGLGDGTTSSSVTPVAVAGGLTFAAVGAGDQYTCGVTSIGAVYCWGGNYWGQLGVGAVESAPQKCGPQWCSTTPVAAVGGHTFPAVNVGEAGVCGLTTSGAPYCWGKPTWGSPAAGGLTFSVLSVGGMNGAGCGVTTTGAAYCWGANTHGQLGTGSTTGPEQCFDHSVQPRVYFPCSTVPVPVAGGLRFAQVDIATDFACGLTSSGKAYCWGNNSSGQLGTGTTITSASPVAVAGGLTFVALSVGYYQACGLTLSGAAYCWGDNSYGQLGNGTTTGPQLCGSWPCSLTPSLVAGGLTFATLSAKGDVCGVTTSGVAYCWGWNGEGELGDGTTTSSSVPVKVVYQP